MKLRGIVEIMRHTCIKIILWKSKKQEKAKVEIHIFKELSCDGVLTEIVCC